MSLDQVGAGRDLGNDFNVIIEIPMNADPIKYEIDKRTEALFVDRFLTTAMHYPCNYGYIPDTIADDGDPIDVLVVSPFPLMPLVVAARTGTAAVAIAVAASQLNLVKVMSPH